MQKHFIAFLMLALTAFAAHADAKTDALIKAAANNNIAKAKRLIAAGANVNAKDYYGMTALMYAAYRYDVDMVKLLLEAGEDVNARTKDGKTALMLADKLSLEMAELLRASGAR